MRNRHRKTGKMFYLQNNLDDIDPDIRIDEKEFQSRWWSFIDDIEKVEFTKA